WIRDSFLPFSRRKWKLSTASTTGDRIRKHITTDLGSLEIPSITRDLLQQYLEQKAALGLSFSVVDHLRWDLRSIFRLAVQDRIITHNPAEMFFPPRTTPSPSRQVLTPQVQIILSVLDLREQLIVQLALFSGMRPGEILALQWKHVAEDHLHVVHRLYRGKLDRPKSERSKRKVALSLGTRRLIQQWRQHEAPSNLDAWMFPSANADTPLGRDNTWRRLIAPKLEAVELGWATFQIMRRTHASLARERGIDPKLVADQLGHALGVNLDVYTVAALDQRQRAVQTVEAAMLVH